MGTSAGVKTIRSFQSRLNRVAEQRAPIEADAPEISVLPDWQAPFRLPMAILGAFFVGLMAVIAARTARLDLLGGTFAGDNADTSMLMDGGLALLGGITLCLLLKYRGIFCIAGNAVGVVVALLFAHNAVYLAPGIHTALYDDAWTAEVTAASEPGSIYFRGGYTTLMPPAESVADEEAVAGEEGAAEEKVMPRVIRLQ